MTLLIREDNQQNQNEEEYLSAERFAKTDIYKEKCN